MSKRTKPMHIWVSTDSVEENVQRVLPAMARVYFAEGRKIVAKKTDVRKLHPFRLATKRFRYTLESFAKIYGPSMKEKLALLKPVQDALGEVNDCVATAERFDAGKQFRAFLSERAARKARHFYRVWKDTFDANGQEEIWAAYLAAVPGLPLRETQATVHSQDLSGNELRRA